MKKYNFKLKTLLLLVLGSALFAFNFVFAIADAPTALTATAGNARVLLNWTAPSTGAVTGYKIYRSTISGSEVQIAAPTGTFTTYVDLTAVIGTTYYYKVTATNISTDSDLSSEVNATPALPVCIEPDPASLVSWWPGEGSALDIKGSNHGTLLGGAIVGVSGKVSQAFNMPSINSSYIDAGNDISLKLNSGTVEAWIKTTSTTGDAGGGYRGIIVKPNAYGLFLVDGVLTVYDWQGGSYGALGARSTGKDLADGQWHHVVMTFQSGVSDGTKVYADGVALSFPSTGLFTTSMTVVPTTGQDNALLIGSNLNSQYFNGIIDEPTVYNQILTQTEVQNIYLADTAGKCNAVPGTPSNFNVTPGTIQATLDWTAPAGALDGYQIYKSLFPNFDINLITPIPINLSNTNYIDGSLLREINYYYKVTATNKGFRSVPTVEKTAILYNHPADPIFAPVATAGESKATLSWPATALATSYKVYLNTESSTSTSSTNLTNVTSGCSVNIAGSTASCTIAGLTNGLSSGYYFFYKASNSGGDSDFSPVSNKVTPQIRPGVPIGLRGIAGDKKINLVWTPADVDTSHSIALGYYVYYSSNGFTTFTKSLQATSSFMTISGLTNGTAYTFKVSSTNANLGGGESALSVESAPVTPIAPVFNVPQSWCSTNTIDTGVPVNGYIASDGTDCSQTYNGNIGLLDYYSFAGKAGQLVTAMMADIVAPGNTFLNLLKVNADRSLSTLPADVDGKPSFNDQSGTCDVPLADLITPAVNNARICNYRLPTDGNYVVAATHSQSSAATGAYVLYLNLVAQTPAIPAKPTVVPGESQTIVNWATVPYATSYKIYRNTSNTTSGATDVTSSCTVHGATGGVLTNVGGYNIHSFKTVGALTFTPNAPMNVEVLVVGGGGAGATWTGGGGGAGGLIYNASFPVSTAVTVTVGAGGAGVTNGVNPSQAASGGNSSFDTLTAIGGGGGGTNGALGKAGGSGGGSGHVNTVGGAGTSGQGNNGGGGAGNAGAPNYGAGGGGGAGGPGLAGTTVAGGKGGIGLSFSITGSPLFYAGGGGGGTYNGGTLGTGGSGVGGNAGYPAGHVIQNGNLLTGANTGSGGGGNINNYPNNVGGANGGSGVVIVRYLATSCTNSGLSNNTDYYYFVKASASGTDSDFSPSSGKVTPQQKPAAPTDLTGTVDDKQVSLNWTAPSGPISGSNIYVSANNGPYTLLNSTPVNANFYVAKTLNNSTPYTFKISATNVGGGEGAKSAPTAPLIPITLPAPTALTASIGAGSMTLNWTAPAVDATFEPIIGYNIKYWTSATVATPVSLDVLFSPAVISGLSGNTTYFFQVAGRTAKGIGSYTSVMNSTPKSSGISIGEPQPDGTYQLINASQTRVNVNGNDYWVDLDGVRAWLWSNGFIRRQTTHIYNHPTGSKSVAAGTLQYKIKESGFYKIFTRDAGGN